ncbi:hypothetical protein BN11_3200009 [Nostocoides australiense Ben110]|uniref:Alpha-1,4-glucan:maltose-1-phosphate maltosyltransferase domain-containing protein n=1 Tax=Nostocoides australiense Ben110 TaxID=1193182 RepID=W6JYL4_9MICO|nr:hypothetical protein BN11_3200009 [Tetrasphaera australiensis Ben110]
MTTPPQTPIGRIPVQDVKPLVDGGARPAKAVVGETFTISATVFREGHDAVNATVVLTRPDGSTQHLPMDCINPGLNLWIAEVTPDAVGDWTYRVEGWGDPFGTWEHDATIKVAAGVDVELMLTEGALLLERAAAQPGRSGEGRLLLDEAVSRLRDSRAASIPTCTPRWTGSRCANTFPPRPISRCSSSASGRCMARGTRSSPAPRGATTTRARAAGSRARSARPRSGCRPSPPWVSTSCT